jgi:hypothetical protein
MNSIGLSDTEFTEFERQGYLILRDFFDLSIVDGVKQSVEEVQDEIIQGYVEKGLISNDYPEEPFETRLTEVYSEYTGDKPTEMRPQLHKAGMFNLFFNPALLDIIETMLGPEIRLYPNYTVRDKVPNGEATLVLWHQDATQSTARREKGHVARSRKNPASAVHNAGDWTSRSFV